MANGIFEFKVINSDGTPAQLSGNGSRIFARYLLDANYIGVDKAFSVVVISPRSKVVVDILPMKRGDDRITTDIHAAPAFGPVAVKARKEAVQGMECILRSPRWPMSGGVIISLEVGPTAAPSQSEIRIA
jgi:diaminopimelate epimerase